MRVWERNVLRVGLDELHPLSGSIFLRPNSGFQTLTSSTGHSKHRPAEIQSHYLDATPGEGESDVTRAATEIKGALAPPHFG
jgi:hypothetical protein